MSDYICVTVEEFISKMHENAINEYHSTEEYRFYHEKKEKMFSDFEFQITEDQFPFAYDCYDLLTEIYRSENKYTYKKAFLDSISFIKLLGIIK